MYAHNSSLELHRAPASAAEADQLQKQDEQRNDVQV